MNRRTALAAVSDALGVSLPQDPGVDTPNPLANRTLPKLSRTTAGIEPYFGTWDVEQKMHLLRRTLFGVRPADLAQIDGMSMSQTVDLLLAPQPEETSLPLSFDPGDTAPGVAVGTTWINATANTATGSRINSLKAWWIGLMLNQRVSLREKMTLFWHNHFVTNSGIVNDPRFSYRYHALLRLHALGNARTLARAITLDGAMLRYLNGNSSTKTSPNENYGRELQELFTIGKGPEVAPGDYTNYTEADVKAAAKLLTGWREMTQTDGTVSQTTWRFTTSRHEAANKTFSARYGNRVITGGSTEADALREIDEMLAMIYGQPETARYLCRKLYRWFVYYVIDDWTEANIIGPMADTLRSANFEVAEALSLLLKSAHFHDALHHGCMIKTPLDHVLGTLRAFDVPFPTDDVLQQYTLWNYLRTQAANQQQNLCDPPSVAGWQAYYQEPQFHELWVNSDTLPKRTRFTDMMMRNGYTTTINGVRVTLKIDHIGLVKQTSFPTDVNVVIDEIARRFFPIPLTAVQKAFLKNTLIPGLPDYEWTLEWNRYEADPNNTQIATSLKNKIQALLLVMTEMPEFQLC
jgi:uncharacterized protein (DUF1800 family)